MRVDSSQLCGAYGLVTQVQGVDYASMRLCSICKMSPTMIRAMRSGATLMVGWCEEQCWMFMRLLNTCKKFNSQHGVVVLVRIGQNDARKCALLTEKF